MPTTPMKAPLLPGPETERWERMLRAREMIGNTAAFNVTGHPAVSVPCGTSDGLPVGLMAVGRWGEDGLVLRAARAVEVTR
jgi:amidase